MLWCSGVLTNRTTLRARFGAPPEISNAELVRLLYLEDGMASVSSVEGTLAWVLWDGRSEELVLVRDRLGTNHLFVRDDGMKVAVSPQIEELLGHCQRPALDPAAMVEQIRGRALPPGRTFFAGIETVEPATAVIFGRTLRRDMRYWEVGASLVHGVIPEREASAVLRETLERVIGQYASHLPSGVTLSSGLDSGTVAAVLRASSQGAELKAVSWLAPELPQADERAGIEAVVAHLGLELVPVRADLLWPLGDGLELAPPLSGPPLSYYVRLWRATFVAARAAGLAVLFTGASGDHLVGGKVFAYLDLLLTGRWLRLMQELAAQARCSSLTYARACRHYLVGPLARQLWFSRAGTEPVLPWLIAPERTALPPPEQPGPRPWLPGRRQRLELLRDRTLPRVLAELTAAGAAHGVEVRHPLADHRLLELAARMPSSASLEGGVRKAALRRALEGALPHEVLTAPRKVLPTAIAARGLREREVDVVRALLRNMRAADLGLVDPAVLAAHYERYRRGEAVFSIFWHTLTLEAWLRAHGG